MQDQGVVFHEGIPDHDALVQWFPPGHQGVLVLDDLMDEGSHDKRVFGFIHQTFTSSRGDGPILVPRHVSRGEVC